MVKKISDARELDWDAAKAAALEIVRVCQEAGFTAPEALDYLCSKVVLVCEQLNVIVAALKITPPESR